MDFKDGADKDEEYAYDANGNMTCGRNKGHTITPQEMVKKREGKNNVHYVDKSDKNKQDGK